MFNSYEFCYMTVKRKGDCACLIEVTTQRWPLNTGDCLIEVTAWEGLTTVHENQLELNHIFFFFFFYLRLKRWPLHTGDCLKQVTA